MVGRPKLQLAPVSTATAKLSLRPGTAQVAIAAIRLRKDADTRPLTARHVVELAESIAVLGLLEPVVLDTAGHLLAGGHRLAALQLLAEPNASRHNRFAERCGVAAGAKGEMQGFSLRLVAVGMDEYGQETTETPFKRRFPSGKVPVQVVDVSGKDGERLALAVETAENNVRRQYTRDEIEALAKRLTKAGYKTTPGKPKIGEMTMLNALQAAVGKSKRQIQNILMKKPTAEDQSEWERAARAFQRAAKRVEKHGDGRTSERAKALLDAAKRAIKA
jgi:hypothetical protein